MFVEKNPEPKSTKFEPFYRSNKWSGIEIRSILDQVNLDLISILDFRLHDILKQELGPIVDLGTFLSQYY